MDLPDMAVDDVREQLGQAGAVCDVSLMVVCVDCTLCVTVPGLLLFSQVVITGIHGC